MNNTYLDLGAIDPPDCDGHDLYVRAVAQLEAERGVDPMDLHNIEGGTYLCLELAALLLRMEEQKTLELSSTLVREQLEKLRASEVEAIVRELTEAQEYDPT